MIKNILLTGGDGFLGYNLFRLLMREGYAVHVFERNKHQLKRLKNEINVTVFDHQDNLDTVFKDYAIDTVIHTATYYGHNNTQVTEIIRSNILFPLSLMETGVKYGLKTFLNTDTFSNVSEIKNNYLAHYNLSKKHCIDWLSYFKGNVKVVNMKLQHMYGVDDNPEKFVMQMIKSIIGNEPEIKLTLGQQERDFIFVDDVSSAYLSVLKNIQKVESMTSIDVGTGITTTIKQFVEKIKELSGSATTLNFGAIPYRENEMLSSKADNKFLLSLGWKHIYSYEEGLKRIIQSEKLK